MTYTTYNNITLPEEVVQILNDGTVREVRIQN